MAVIVATNQIGRGRDGEFPVLSFGTGVDSGYIIIAGTVFVGNQHKFQEEYNPGISADYRFHIDSCDFQKVDGHWYYLDRTEKFPIMYGGEILEEYCTCTGDFEKITSRFGGD